MDMQNLILQGGALAVVLFAFLFVLHWLLRHFTNSLKRIETSIHANSLVLVNLARLQYQSNYRLEHLIGPDRDVRLKELMTENLNEWMQIKAVLAALSREGTK